MAELIIFGFIAILLIWILSIPGKQTRNRRRWYAHHAAAVSGKRFRQKRLLNKSEYKLLCRLEFWLRTRSDGHRLFAWVSLGEVLQIEDVDAFRAINAKHYDFLIIDRFGWPVIVIEYQRSGHFQNHAVECDAIKRTALESAGITFMEILEEYEWDKMKVRFDDVVQKIIRPPIPG